MAAPAKGATLLNSFGVDASLVPLAAEKSPLKFGMMIPGARIPIVDESTVKRPDAYLLLAWNFLDEILEKERAYLEGRRRFHRAGPRSSRVDARGLEEDRLRMPEAVVIFGATGFVGRNLVAGFQARSRASSPSAAAARRWRRRAMHGHGSARQHRPLPADTVVINLAAQRYDASRFDMAQSDILDANVEIANAVYRFCIRRGVREVRAASSVAVYEAGLAALDDRRAGRLQRPSKHKRSLLRVVEKVGRNHRGVASRSFRHFDYVVSPVEPLWPA